MATELAVALRRQAALDRIAEALGIDVYVQGRDAGMNNAVLLERIADAVESMSTGEPVEELTVAELERQANATNDPALLETMREMEARGKNRKTALTAIDTRLAELEEAEAEEEVAE